MHLCLCLHIYHLSVSYLLFTYRYLSVCYVSHIYHQSVIYLSVIITYLLSIINLPLVPFLWRTLTNAVTDPPLDKTVDPGCGRGQQQAWAQACIQPCAPWARGGWAHTVLVPPRPPALS